ncbi:MAG TPA: response regulator [Pirellulales bacterium]|jgi:CheY-like chemotaxis protein|nr:response regulator [Pirellulales bacterium]
MMSNCDLPVADRSLDARVAVAVRGAASRPLAELNARLLLAEDTPDIRRLVSEILKKQGAEVVAVENGERAVAVALEAANRGEPFDVVLMDIQMPVLDGLEATRRLRNRNYSGPIVALTAHAMTDDRTQCLQAGCDDYETKPVDRERLAELVARHIRRHRGKPGRGPATKTDLS